jgi:hypothetical protein
MLGAPGELKAKFGKNTLTITTPELTPGQAPCRYAYTFKITGATLLPETTD